MSLLSRFHAHAARSLVGKSSARRVAELGWAVRPVVDRLEGRVLFATQPVNSLTLINADTDQPIASYNPLVSNVTLDLATLPTRNLNIRANMGSGTIGSVRFAYDGNGNYRTDNAAPFAVASESGGNYAAWTPTVGTHQLTATPYGGANATGSKGTARSITFTVKSTPVVSVAATDASAAETVAGAAANTGRYTITRTGSTASSMSVNVALGGTAVNGSDYARLNTPVTIPAGSASTVVTLAPINDAAVEGSETAVLTLAAGTGYVMSGAAGNATVTIADNDVAPTPTPTPTNLPTLSINDVTLNEGNSGLTAFVFTVTRSGDTSGASSVNYATGGGTGSPTNDYRAASGVLSFAAGETSKQIAVQVDGDTFVESDNTFFVNLSGAAGATIADAQGAGVIVNDDPSAPAPPPTLGVVATDADAAERLPGAAANPGVFTITRPGDTTAVLTVNFALGGSAGNGADYGQVFSPVTIPAGSTSATVTISPIDDATIEGTESAVLTLTASSAYAISSSNGSATITIADNDSTPTPTPTQTPWTSPFAVPTTIEAEFYDKGGEGIAYHDVDAANLNGSFRLGEGVDVETASDVGGGYAIGHVQAGEWTEYSITVAQAGVYDLGIRYASGSAGGIAHLDVGGVNVTGPMSLGYTGGDWQTWNTVWKNGVTLAAGEHVLRLSIDSANIAGQDVGNVNSILVRKAAPGATAPAWPSSWQAAKSANSPRFESAGTTVNGKIYVFGGFKDDQWRVDRTYTSYDPASNTWTDLGTMPVSMAESHAGIATDGRYIYLAGGFGGNLNPSASPTQWISDKVWRYDPANNSFQQIATLPQFRGAGALDYLNGNLHYIGGNPADRVTNLSDHFVLNLASGQWTTAAPTPDAKDHMSSAVLGGKIYAIGGEHGHDELHLQRSTVHVYDPGTNAWTELAPLPFAKSHIEAGTFVSDGKIIMAGGQVDNFQPTNNVVAYDPAANAWTTLAPLPRTLQGAIVQRVGDQIVIALGGVQTYQPQSDVWVGQLPAGA